MENTAPFFSIVMPVYNVEKHLNKAIDSVLAQSFTDFELILVDDCSPDACAGICDFYTEHDTRIRSIHLQENGGLSNARNMGMEIAGGTYITFMDSDDYVEADALQNVYDSLQKNDADVVIFGLVEEYFSAEDNLLQSFPISYEHELYISAQDALRKEVIELERKTLLGYAWNKFYRFSKIKENNLRFEKITLIEDVLFNIHFLPFATKMNILRCTPYHYMKRMDASLTNKFVKDYFALHRQRVFELLQLYKSWQMCTPQVCSVLADIYVRYIFSALQRNCEPQAEMTHSERVLWLEDLYCDTLFNVLSPYFSGNNPIVRILSFCLAHKCKAICLFLGRIIYIVKKRFPKIFSRAKQNR